MSCRLCSRLKRLRNGTSPTSATRRSAIGASLSAWWNGPMRSMLRIARGPSRAPARLVTARSIGTPISATCKPPKSARSGASGRYGAVSSVGMPE